jgi:hypothetical protein
MKKPGAWPGFSISQKGRAYFCCSLGLSAGGGNLGDEQHVGGPEHENPRMINVALWEHPSGGQVPVFGFMVASFYWKKRLYIQRYAADHKYFRDIFQNCASEIRLRWNFFLVEDLFLNHGGPMRGQTSCAS